MSDTNLNTNAYIELTEIRKLDNLLTQCESRSCENICIDCCANLGSLDNVMKYSDYTTPHSCSTNADEPYVTCYDITASNLVPIVSVTNAAMDILVVNNSATTTNQQNADSESFATMSPLQKQKSLNNDKNNCCRFCKTNATTKQNFSKQRFFSLDKERSEKFNNKFEKKVVGGSENTLMKSRKQTSISSFVNNVKDTCAHPKRKQLSIIKTSVIACENCDLHSNHIIPPRLITTSAANKDLRSMSRKSSLKETSAQLVIDVSSAIDKESSVLRDSLRTKFSPQSVGKKMSIKGQSVHSDQLLFADKESLLQTEKLFLHDKKLPEPVETVGGFCVIINI